MPYILCLPRTFIECGKKLTLHKKLAIYGALIVSKLIIFTVFQSHATGDLRAFSWALQVVHVSPVSVCEGLMIDDGDHLGSLLGSMF